MSVEMPDRGDVPQMNLERRAGNPLSTTPRPFLRWAGSKRLVLHHIAPHLPRVFGKYFEPFFGGGALFFLLRPASAVISDSCVELMATYAAVRDNASAVLRYLIPLTPDKGIYYRVRRNRSPARFKRAAEFIYLNKNCWNGLYRVNSEGEFNVPFGRPKGNNLTDKNNLRECGQLLSRPGIQLRCGDFEESLASAKAGDLVFLDPPYVTGHKNNGFIDYNEVLFSWSDQKRLAAVARQLMHRGCFVIVTNADHPEIRRLYGGFVAVRFDRKSTIASDASKRGRTSELLLLGSRAG